MSLTDQVHSDAAPVSGATPVQAMPHVIYGYPTVEASLAWMEALLAREPAYLEVQFPFSDPVADGPEIVSACHEALRNQPELDLCLDHLGRLAQRYPKTELVLMSYLNILYRHGLSRVVAEAARSGIKGLIIPDLPIEAAADYREACDQEGIAPIWMITPTTGPERRRWIAEQARGMLYCVSRTGVTGQAFEDRGALQAQLKDIRRHTHQPLAVGFGIQHRHQVTALSGHADVAVVGSALLKAFRKGGIDGGLSFYRSLWPE